MKRVLVALLLTLLISSLAASSSQPIPRHLNPSDLPDERPSPIDLLTLYSFLFNTLMKRDYEASFKGLKELFNVYAPENVRYVFNRFNELLREEVRQLNSTERHIKLSLELLRSGFLDEAMLEVKEGWLAVTKAKIIHSDLHDSAIELAKAIGFSPGFLLDRLSVLQGLIDRYSLELSSIEASLEELEKAGLQDTEVNLFIVEREVWVGSEINVYGFLSSSDGYPLSGREVAIYLDGLLIASLRTNENGIFNAKIPTPSIYKPKVSLFAKYTPKGDDVGKYKAAKSDEISLELIFETPFIEAWLSPAEAMPLEVVRLYGFISKSSRPPSNVILEAFGIRSVALVGEDGYFEAFITVPASAAEGEHVVELSTPAEGVLAPSKKTLTLMVYRKPVYLSVKIQGLALAGGSVNVLGRVLTSLSEYSPVEGAEVLITGLGSTSKTYSDPEGWFSAELNVPIFTLTSYREIKVTVKVADPRYKVAESSYSVLVLNPLPLAAPVLAFIMLSRSLVSMLRRGGPPEGLETVKPGKEGERGKEVIDPGSVAAVYIRAVNLVESITGVAMKPSYTMREYLTKVSFMIEPKLYKIFSEVSLAVEGAIYGGESVDMLHLVGLVDEMRRVAGLG